MYEYADDGMQRNCCNMFALALYFEMLLSRAYARTPSAVDEKVVASLMCQQTGRHGRF